MPKKAFKLLPHEFRSLAENRGYCFATDMITVNGLRVGYMYREQPNDHADSGWRFFAGRETDEYANDPANLEIYDVNTVANYDPDIVALLESPFPTASERDAAGALVAVENPADSPSDGEP